MGLLRFSIRGGIGTESYILAGSDFELKSEAICNLFHKHLQNLFFSVNAYGGVFIYMFSINAFEEVSAPVKGLPQAPMLNQTTP